MDFNDLKSNWKNMETDSKSKSDLLKMTKIRNHPKLRRMRIKLVIESILLILFLAVYNNIFDGAEKPLWLNLILITGASLFILTDLAAFFTLRNLAKEANLTESLKKLYFKLKRITVFSVISSLLFGAAIILFFTAGIDFNPTKYFMLAGMIATLLLMTFLSYKNWRKRIERLKVSGRELEEGI